MIDASWIEPTEIDAAEMDAGWMEKGAAAPPPEIVRGAGKGG